MEASFVVLRKKSKAWERQKSVNLFNFLGGTKNTILTFFFFLSSKYRNQGLTRIGGNRARKSTHKRTHARTHTYACKIFAVIIPDIWRTAFRGHRAKKTCSVCSQKTQKNTTQMERVWSVCMPSTDTKHIQAYPAGATFHQRDTPPPISHPRRSCLLGLTYRKR